MIEQQLAFALRHVLGVYKVVQAAGAVERAGRRRGAQSAQILVQQAHVAADKLAQPADKDLHVGVVEQQLRQRVVHMVAKLQLRDVLAELQGEHLVGHR